MTDSNLFEAIRIPADLLIAMDWRPYHFLFQPVHFIVRILHILSMAAFFGFIGLLDIRLIGGFKVFSLRTLEAALRPWLYSTFATATVTGVLLFFYDPVRIGSRAFWVPKLISIALGLGNVVFLHRINYIDRFEAGDRRIRYAGMFSLAMWTLALVFACLNAEEAPKLLLLGQ